MKTKLDNELNLIKQTAIRDLTRRVLDACPDCFWTMPAATSGKYHPGISLGEGGLVRHTKAVVRLTVHLLDMAGVDDTDPRYGIAISAALLHDCCKKADGERHTAFDHPLRAAQLIRDTDRDIVHNMEDEIVCPEGTADKIADIVAAHMGRWNTNSYDPTAPALPLPTSALQRLVHTADFLASRKDITLANIA